MVKQAASAARLCFAGRYLMMLLLTIMVIVGYLFMIHDFAVTSNPDIDIENNNINTIVIAQDYIEEFKNSITIIQDNKHMSNTNNYYLSKAINSQKYEKDDFSFFWTDGDGSPLFINASKYDTRHEIGYRSFVFCPMPKNGCSAWKQLLRRIKGETLYLADDYWSLHSQQNNLEQDRIHRFGVNGSNAILYDSEITHAVFIRDSIERSLSAFLDKCIGSHWSKKHWCTPSTNRSKISHKIYSHFDLYINSIVNRELSLDFHWLPQNFVCDLHKFGGRYNIYYSSDINARYQFLTDIGDKQFPLKTWNKIGAYGWVKNDNKHRRIRRLLSQKQKPVQIMGKNATQQMDILDLSASFLDKESYHTINTSLRLFDFFRADLLAKVVAYYESDYILFSMSLPVWICNFVNVNYNDIVISDYGKYSIYYEDYDHNAIVNDSRSGIVWKRNNEIKNRMEKYNTFIESFYEMMDFDDVFETIIHKIRGIVALSNILTFVDVNILPQCFFKYIDWDFSKMIDREKNNMIQLIDVYFNRNMKLKRNRYRKVLDEFVIKDEEKENVNAEKTFMEWRNGDKILYHNIRSNMLWMRDIPRKKLWKIHHQH